MLFKSKKGVETNPIGFIGGFIIVALVVGIVGYLIVNSGGVIERQGGIVSVSDLEAKYQFCKGYMSVVGAIPKFQVCDKFDEVNVDGIKGDTLISCDYDKIQERLVDENVADATVLNDACADGLEYEHCLLLSGQEGSSFKGVWINGVSYGEDCKDAVEKLEEDEDEDEDEEEEEDEDEEAVLVEEEVALA